MKRSKVAPARRPKASSNPVQAEAEHHRRTRRAHLTERAEDYVELIADLIATTGEARTVDLARRLGVTHVTVSRTLARLHRQGLVSTRPYRAIFLTDDGAQLARRAQRRHQIVVQFLQAMGVPDQTARADAEGIEHHVSQETLAAFERYCRASGLGSTKHP